jgi:TctA family transporter
MIIHGIQPGPSVISEQPAPFDIETLERFVGEVKPLIDQG